MRKFFCFIWLVCLTFSVGAQEVLSLDSCRALAIANNKELLISQEKINSAHYQRKAAFTNYLPDARLRWRHSFPKKRKIAL